MLGLLTMDRTGRWSADVFASRGEEPHERLSHWETLDRIAFAADVQAQVIRRPGTLLIPDLAHR